MYIVIEIQTNNEGETAIAPVKTFTEQSTALQEFFQTVAYAVVSTLQIHTVVLMTADGNIIRKEVYRH